MRYVEVLLGNLLREKLIERRTRQWRTQLGENHQLTADELDTLAPYIEYVSHYGSRKELLALGLVFTPFTIILLGIAWFMLPGSLVTMVVSSGLSGPVIGAMGVIPLVTTVFPLALLGVVGYVVWRRWKRYRLATEIRTHLTTDPRRLCEDDGPLPESRAEIDNAATTIFGG